MMKTYNYKDFSWDNDSGIYEGIIIDDDPIYHLSSGDLRGTEIAIVGKDETRVFEYVSVDRECDRNARHKFACHLDILGILNFKQKFNYNTDVVIYIYAIT
jgi:hypothetical protein